MSLEEAERVVGSVTARAVERATDLEAVWAMDLARDQATGSATGRVLDPAPLSPIADRLRLHRRPVPMSLPKSTRRPETCGALSATIDALSDLQPCSLNND